MAIRVNTLGANYGVEGFKCFGGEKNGRAKSANVLCNVKENMEFWLINPAYTPPHSAHKKVLDLNIENILVFELVEGRCNESTQLTQCILMSSISGCHISGMSFDKATQVSRQSFETRS